MTENAKVRSKKKGGRISEPLFAVIIEPASHESEKLNVRAYAECVKQIKELIRKDGRKNVRDIREGVNRGTGETWL